MGTKVQNKAYLTRDWTQGNITGNLLSLAWPVMVSQTINTIGPFIDLIWVGKLGSASVAGVGIGGMAAMMGNAALAGLTMGMRVMIGRAIGAGDKETAIHYARQYFLIGATYAIVMALIGIFLAEPILGLFGVESDVIKEGASYLRILFIGIITMTLITFSEGTMQASGDTMIPMRIALTYRLLHILLCPMLIFGIGFFPKLGVSGAALSDVITQGLGGILGLFVLFSGFSRLKLNFNNLRFDPSAFLRMVKIGLPNSFMAIQQMLSMLVLVGFIADFGTTAVAAHTIYQRVESILMVLTMSIGMSSGVLAAQNMGAKKPERAAKSSWVASGFASLIMVLGAIILLIWAEPIVRIFNSDPSLVEMAAAFLRIACAALVPLGINGVLRHTLTGLGDTLAAFIMEIVFTWGMLIPLVWLSNNFTDFGIWGIRWILVIRNFFGGLIFALYFWWGKWKTKKI